ncbi:MAG: GGDEF domain-containing response regulator [Burkholderiales bacterium]|nr:GGDEF domain-containing response regulator [Burkholderiales bacterium]
MRQAEPIRVLLVEDSEDDALLLERRLRAAFPLAALRRVDSAERMRAALAEGPWDVVISDHVMPGFDSEAALALLRESGSDAPFILYSGCLDEGRGALAMRVGASDWIAKHDPARIVPVIERELRNVRLRREKERVEREARELASYDALTRLPNRSLFCQQAQLRLDAIEAERSGAALLYIDLDRFMRINETLGYAAGDAVMRQIAVRLRAGAPAGSLVARLGQDEFAILAAVAESAREPRRIAERLARRFAEPIVVNDQEFYVTLSVGVSLYPEHGTDCATLLKNAESAVHFVKRLGGNGHRVYQAELQAASCESLRLENELRHAIVRRQLHLVYQPIYDIAAQRVVAAEALLRWRHPEMGLVPPDRFIPVADDTGQIHAIGAWVLEQACAEARAWGARCGRPIAVAVNFSATQFRHRQFAARVLGILRASGLSPHLLEMEITEGTAMHDAEAAAEVLGAFKRAGVRVAIDDFGTGYSSLSYLRRLPIDILKIDKSFMRDVPHDADNLAIVRTILALGHAMKLECHAEGVETPAQLELLRAERCARAQGYLLGRPVEARAFAELLAAEDGAAAAAGAPLALAGAAG